MENLERVAIRAALDAHQGNVSAAACQPGIHRQILQLGIANLS